MDKTGPDHFKDGIERVQFKALKHLEFPGKPCDNCQLPMHQHLWFDMNKNCDIVNCSLKDDGNGKHRRV